MSTRESPSKSCLLRILQGAGPWARIAPGQRAGLSKRRPRLPDRALQSTEEAVRLGKSKLDDLIGAYLKGARTIDYPLEDEKLRGALYELYKQEYDAQILPSLAFDILAYLPNDLLPKSDLASMSSSIEARVPFVDRFLARDISIVQSILGPQLGIGTKGILKEVLTRYLPEKLVFRSKKGFGVPLKSYSFPSFRSDFDAACEFHLQNRDTFSVSDDIKKFIQKGMRNITMKKYPRFAFALVSNWKLFERK